MRYYFNGVAPSRGQPGSNNKKYGKVSECPLGRGRGSIMPRWLRIPCEKGFHEEKLFEATTIEGGYEFREVSLASGIWKP
jgi:hypothetical protein